MSRYVYPAIITIGENGRYLVDFPDVPHCYTSGSCIAEALIMAEEVLTLTMYEIEELGGIAPPATMSFGFSELGKNQVMNLVACDTEPYRRRNMSRCGCGDDMTVSEWLTGELGWLSGSGFRGKAGTKRGEERRAQETGWTEMVPDH